MELEEVPDTEKNCKWLQKADLKDSTKALIMAAQEQDKTSDPEMQNSTTANRARAAKCAKVPRSTVQHTVAECEMQAGRAYNERHNQAAGIVYRNICAACGLEGPKS